MAAKTNALRIIEKAGIPYKEAFYPYDENDLSGIHAAEALNFPPEQMFKTLVTRGDSGRIHVFCIPVCSSLDLKKAAKAASEKNVSMVPVKELLPLTGYIRGGCSPVGMKKTYPTHIEETCQLYDEIAISAGARGHQVILAADALAKLIGAEISDLIL